jgi:hypothetical protein
MLLEMEGKSSTGSWMTLIGLLLKEFLDLFFGSLKLFDIIFCWILGLISKFWRVGHIIVGDMHLSIEFL